MSVTLVNSPSFLLGDHILAGFKDHAAEVAMVKTGLMWLSGISVVRESQGKQNLFVLCAKAAQLSKMKA